MRDFITIEHRIPLFVTFRDRVITFSKACAIALEFPKKIKIQVSKAGDLMAISASDDLTAFPFFTKAGEGKQTFYRISSRELMSELERLSGIQFGRQPMRFGGLFDEETKTVLFDLKKGAEVYVNNKKKKQQ